MSRVGDGTLVGFVNVAWDGGDHAFLLDTKTRGSHQRRGIGKRVVRLAAEQATAAGCEWLHVDFDRELEPFYLDACGFERTDAGVIHLPSIRENVPRPAASADAGGEAACFAHLLCDDCGVLLDGGPHRRGCASAASGHGALT